MATTKIDKTADVAIKKLQTLLMGMCGRTGYTPDAVFEGLLDYIIGYLNPSLTPEPVEGWKFKHDDLPTFHEMLREVIECYKNEIPRRRWYDPFGDLYMAIHSGGGGKGQFFTPPSVAQCVAEVNCASWEEPTGQQTPFGRRITISDCAAGSGRMPLAGYCVVLEKMQRDWGYTPTEAEARRPYVSCEDLDYNCVKMSAINLAFHGCFGECVCHDSLCEPDKVRLGFIINETMWPFPTGIPSIRKEMNPLRFVATRLWAARGSADRKTLKDEPPTDRKKSEDVLPLGGGEQSQESGVSDFTPETPLSDTVQSKEKKQAVQLTLW